MALLGEVEMDITNDFRRSVEFDLYRSEFGSALLEEYHISSKLGSGTTFLLTRKSDLSKFVLKAISYCDEISNTLLAIAPFKCLGFSEIVDVSISERFIYIVRAYIEGEIMSISDIQKNNASGLRRMKQIVDVLINLKAMNSNLRFDQLCLRQIVVTPFDQICFINPECVYLESRVNDRVELIAIAEFMSNYFVGNKEFANVVEALQTLEKVSIHLDDMIYLAKQV